MKTFLILILSLPFFLVSCAQNRHYERVPVEPRPKSLVVLKGGSQYDKLSPYEVNGQTYYPLPHSKGYLKYGEASWYGHKFHGRPTANGEIYDMYQLTAAHKTLPLGTYVSVTNLSNQKQVVVRINDRGPFVKGRIIDLSYVAAKNIGLVGPGTADVKIVALGKEVGKLKRQGFVEPVVEVEDLDRGEFTVQVGAFRDKGNALRLVDRLKVLFDEVTVVDSEGEEKEKLFRVRVSKSKSLEEAGKIEKKLEDMGFENAFILRL
jgi:rare lipoprotein A